MEEKIKKARQKRTRSPEAKLKAIDAQIKKLQAEREELLKPAKLQQIMESASEKYSIEEIAQRLEIEI